MSALLEPALPVRRTARGTLRRLHRVGTAPTPYLDLDVTAAVTRFQRLRATLPGTDVHYPVRANPEPALLAALAVAGCAFDVTGPAEVVTALRAGATPGDLVHSGPVGRREDVAFAARLGVRLFTVGSPEEVEKVAAGAPGAAVLCRISPAEDASAEQGCSPGRAVQVLRVAAAAGLEAAGVSFRLGPQRRDPAAWEGPVARSAAVFDVLRAGGLDPWLLDLGGGLPARLDDGCPPLPSYGAAIETFLRRHFGGARPRTMVAPGRAIVADAGALVCTVTGMVWRGETRWVLLDAGPTGSGGPLDGPRRRVRTSADGGATGPCVLAGPAGTGTGAPGEPVPVLLPLSLAAGDTVRLPATGAYPGGSSTVRPHGLARPAAHRR